MLTWPAYDADGRLHLLDNRRESKALCGVGVVGEEVQAWPRKPVCDACQLVEGELGGQRVTDFHDVEHCWAPQRGMQFDMLASAADVKLVGGGPGGGKTFASILEMSRGIWTPGFRGLICRKFRKDVFGSDGVWQKGRKVFKTLDCFQRESIRDSIFHFEDDVEIHAGHLNTDEDRDRLGSQDFALVVMEQAEQMAFEDFQVLSERNRSTCGYEPTIILSFNAPPPDHWLQAYIDWYLDEDGVVIQGRSGKIRWFVPDPDDKPQWFDTRDEALAYASTDRTDIDAELRGLLPRSFVYVYGDARGNRALLQEDPSYLTKLLNQPKHKRLAALGGVMRYQLQAGDLFPFDSFVVVTQDELPKQYNDIARGYDLAYSSKNRDGSKRKNRDSTVGIKVAKSDEAARLGKPRYYVLDVQAFQEKLAKRESRILRQAIDDGKRCKVGVLQDMKGSGGESAERQRDLLRNAGFTAAVYFGSRPRCDFWVPAVAAVQRGEVAVLITDANLEWARGLEPLRGVNPNDHEPDDGADAFTCALLALNAPTFAMA